MALVTPPEGKDFQALLDRVQRLMERVQRLAQKMVDSLNMLSKFPGFPTERVQQEMAKFDAKLSELFTKVGKFFSIAGWPWALWGAGDAWRTQVGENANWVANEIIKKHMGVDEHWKGTAAESYSNNLPKQAEYYNSIKTLTTKLEDNLNKSAWGIVLFWGGVAVTIAVLAAGLVAVIAEICGVITAPAAPITAAAAVAGALATIAGTVLAAVGYLQKIAQANTGLEQGLSYFSASPDNPNTEKREAKWPGMSKDINDGWERD